MTKFNRPATKPAVHSPITSEATPSGTTYEGGAGYARDAQSELFLLAVSSFGEEDSFYESKDDRATRYRQLVHSTAISDPDWTARFLHWLRTVAHMRTASLVGAAEYVKAWDDASPADQPNPFGTGGRQVVDSVLQRADEPGEMLAYWTSRYGRAIPKPIKRGVADAVRRLYNERNLLKYDTASKGFRFGDVLELTHASPDPGKPWQGDLFKHAIDRRHHRENVIPEVLNTLRHNAMLRADGLLTDWLNPGRLSMAGMTWEDALSAVGSKVDKARLWEALIPSMGYMALLRNLRNFDQAGVSDVAASRVMDKLADPDEVARSKQLPFRFLSAHRAVPSLRWGYALEKALALSLGNIPRLGGRTLILVDTSSSMESAFSKDGTLMRWDAAVLFGVALAHRCDTADVVSFSSAQRFLSDRPGAKTKRFPLQQGESLLRSLERWKAGDQSGSYFLGGGTDTPAALRTTYVPEHDRVVIVTDEQAARDGSEVGQSIPAHVPMYTWNLAGYSRGHAPSGPNRHSFGGLTDQAFGMIRLLEAGRNATWPF